MENIKQGTGCGIVKRGEVSFVFHPWPAPLKAFLATELAKFPLAKQISEFSEGLYLVAAQFKDGSDFWTGETCQNGKGGKKIVFYSKRVFVEQRKQLDRLDKSYVDTTIFGRSMMFDHAIATFFHELFHVYDDVFYMNGSPDVFDKRMAMIHLSWKDDLVTSIFEASRPANLPLSEGVQGASSALEKVRDFEAHGYKPNFKAKQKSLSLSSPVNDYMQDLVFLRDKTNFLHSYAATNALEDFASSLEAYYTATRYGFVDPLEEVGHANAVPLYIHDPQKIMKTSKKHKDKICFMTRAVLGECNL